MAANHLRSLEKIKAENGGVLPSDLYLQTNEELSKLLYDLTGKFPPPRTSKKVLVARIERHTHASTDAKATKKRNIDEVGDIDDSHTATAPKKTKRGCLPELTAGQISEMRRVLGNSSMESHTHKELYPMWGRMGVIRQFPHRDSKKNIIQAMREFAERNLEFHGLTAP